MPITGRVNTYHNHPLVTGSHFGYTSQQHIGFVLWSVWLWFVSHLSWGEPDDLAMFDFDTLCQRTQQLWLNIIWPLKVLVKRNIIPCFSNNVYVEVDIPTSDLRRNGTCFIWVKSSINLNSSKLFFVYILSRSMFS